MNQFVVQAERIFKHTQQIHNHTPNSQQHFKQIKFTQFQ